MTGKQGRGRFALRSFVLGRRGLDRRVQQGQISPQAGQKLERELEANLAEVRAGWLRPGRRRRKPRKEGKTGQPPTNGDALDEVVEGKYGPKQGRHSRRPGKG